MSHSDTCSWCASAPWSAQNIQICTPAWAVAVGGIRLWAFNWYPKYGWKELDVWEEMEQICWFRKWETGWSEMQSNVLLELRPLSYFDTLKFQGRWFMSVLGEASLQFKASSFPALRYFNVKGSNSHLLKILSKSGKKLSCSWIMDKCVSWKTNKIKYRLIDLFLLGFIWGN